MSNDYAVRRVPLDQLTLDPRNARLHGDRNREAVRASLEAHGQREPVVVQAGTLRVIGGNCRVEEMRALGWGDVWVHEYRCTDEEATQLSLRLNRTAELAEWDPETLEEILCELKDADVALDGLGWSDLEAEQLLGPGGFLPTDYAMLAGQDLEPSPLPAPEVVGEDTRNGRYFCVWRTEEERLWWCERLGIAPDTARVVLLVDDMKAQDEGRLA